METIKLIAIITPILITAATVYLRLFVDNRFNELLNAVRDEFVSKEVFEMERTNLHDKLRLIEPKSARR